MSKKRSLKKMKKAYRKKLKEMQAVCRDYYLKQLN